LNYALNKTQADVDDLDAWVGQLDDSLVESVKLRVEGEKVGLPSPVLTPYLVGLLVMLGLLGTFAGMVDTLKGAVLALEGTSELEAIRAGLTAPINGLSLAFGTSVAGVATSAMLGLISVLSRRERIQACKLLDKKTGTAFKHFSLHYNRQETFKAMQFQAQALPEVAKELKELAQSLTKMTDDVGNKLVESQKEIAGTVQSAYSSMVNSVEEQLKESIASTSKIAGESLEPVVKKTLEGMSSQVQESIEKTNTQLNEIAKAQLSNFTEQFESATDSLMGSFNGVSKDLIDNFKESDEQRQKVWSESMALTGEKLQTSQQQISDSLNETVGTINSVSTELLASFKSSDEQRQKVWSESMALTSGQLQTSHQQVSESLKDTVGAINDTAKENSLKLISDVSELLGKSEKLVEQRIESESNWQTQQSENIQKLIDGISEELRGLTKVEEERSEKHQERLLSLEESVAKHLKDLGGALEDPMARLIETSSQAPRAAAELIEKLREEMLKNIERDNQLIDERQRSMEALAELSDKLQSASEQQHSSIETLVSQSSEMLTNVGKEFTESLAKEAEKVTDLADDFSANTIELSSLGESFSTAVSSFANTNDETLGRLEQLQAAIEKSAERSDEQLAYYVAQAREIIDHSILSQKEIFDGLRAISKSEESEADMEEVA
jgi:DNA anti-recombination protein RmuC